MASEGDRRAVDAKDCAQAGADLAQGDVRLHGGQQPRHQIVGPARGPLDGIERPGRPSGPAAAGVVEPLGCRFSTAGSGWKSAAGGDSALTKSLTPTTTRARPRPPAGSGTPRPGSRAAGSARSPPPRRPARRSSRCSRSPRPRCRGERLDGRSPPSGSTVAATPDSWARTCWVRSASARGRLGGQRQRLVARVRVQRLLPPSMAASAWTRDAHDVVHRAAARSGSSPPSGRGSEASRARVLAPKRSRMIRAQSRRAARNLATSSRKSLCALKKNESRGANSSTSRPALERRVDVGDAVGEREGHLLDRGRARLAHVVAADRDRVPVRHAVLAEPAKTSVTSRSDGPGG